MLLARDQGVNAPKALAIVCSAFADALQVVAVKSSGLRELRGR
jgi:hypothetical protein